MNIKITSREILVTPAMKEAIISKMDVLEKFLSNNDNIKVLVTNVKKDISVSVMIVYDGKLVKLSKTGEDFYFILGDVVDRLNEKLEKLHSKKIKKLKDQEKALNSFEYDSELDEKEYVSNELIKKKKKFKLTEMTVEEAVDTMESLGHESFMFLDINTGKPCMVYIRNDAEYGLIETD